MALELNHMSLQSPKMVLFSAARPHQIKSRRIFISSAFGVTSNANSNGGKPYTPRELHVQKKYSMSPQKIEIFKSLEFWADQNLLPILKPVEKSWQPQDFLPNPSSHEFQEQVKKLRGRTKNLPDEYFVVLVGDMITEEALPTYQTLLNTFDGVRDETGASLNPWAVWTRAWTAEENRHGDLLNKYLYLSGRVDMKQIEKTIQYLIGSGAV